MSSASGPPNPIDAQPGIGSSIERFASEPILKSPTRPALSWVLSLLVGTSPAEQPGWSPAGASKKISENWTVQTVEALTQSLADLIRKRSVARSDPPAETLQPPTGGCARPALEIQGWVEDVEHHCLDAPKRVAVVISDDRYLEMLLDPSSDDPVVLWREPTRLEHRQTQWGRSKGFPGLDNQDALRTRFGENRCKLVTIGEHAKGQFRGRF